MVEQDYVFSKVLCQHCLCGCVHVTVYINVHGCDMKILFCTFESNRYRRKRKSPKRVCHLWVSFQAPKIIQPCPHAPYSFSMLHGTRLRSSTMEDVECFFCVIRDAIGKHFTTKEVKCGFRKFVWNSKKIKSKPTLLLPHLKHSSHFNEGPLPSFNVPLGKGKLTGYCV